MQNIYKNITLLILLIIGINFTYAQNNVEFVSQSFPDDPNGLKEAIKDISRGDAFYEQKNYTLALQFYSKADEFNSFNGLLNFKIGLCYLEFGNYEKILNYFKKAYMLNSEVNPDIHYYLGEAYHLNSMWDEALNEFEKQKKMIPKEQWDLKIEKISKKIDECNIGKQLTTFPIDVKIQNLGEMINSPYPDYSPILSADEYDLYLTSRRNTTTGEGMSELDNQFYEDIYHSYKEDGKWSKAENVGSPLNTNTNDATIALSVDGQRMIVYKDINGGDIFESVLNGIQWTKPVPFPKTINTPYHESFASFSPDGNTIYFVSDKPKGGFGGKDIYMSTKKENGNWGNAINLGPIINSKYDESGVYMHPDGKTLYFSSKGHSTMGGFDIFKSTYNATSKSWTTPENVGSPINTPGDDIFVIVSANGKRLYYSSSNKEGFGDKDIYVISYPEAGADVIVNTEDQLISFMELSKTVKLESSIKGGNTEVTIFKGRVLDDETNLPISADIEIADLQLSKIIARMKSNSNTGKFLVALPSGKNYGVTIKVDGYLINSSNFDIPAGTKYQEFNKEIKIKKVKTGASIVLNNIFFDFNKFDLRPESSIEINNLVQILEQYPTMSVEISGHTDNIGSDEYNQKLSERRAKAVYDVLVNEKKISPKRLSFIGFGKTHPVAPNTNSDGTDNPEGRQLNRRTEFKIITM